MAFRFPFCQINKAGEDEIRNFLSLVASVALRMDCATEILRYGRLYGMEECAICKTLWKPRNNTLERSRPLCANRHCYTNHLLVSKSNVRILFFESSS